MVLGSSVADRCCDRGVTRDSAATIRQNGHLHLCCTSLVYSSKRTSTCARACILRLPWYDDTITWTSATMKTVKPIVECGQSRSRRRQP